LRLRIQGIKWRCGKKTVRVLRNRQRARKKNDSEKKNRTSDGYIRDEKTLTKPLFGLGRVQEREGREKVWLGERL